MRFPREVDLIGQKQFRIIPSVFPSINFFEDLVSPEEMEILWEIEGLTNERLRHETGDIFLVPEKDRVSGKGSSVVMAAFTHIYFPSRFTDGSYGIYYAALTRETAIRETVYHRERFLQATNEDATEITMRLYGGKILKPLHDVRTEQYHPLHDPYDYSQSQVFGKMLKEKNSWGAIYNSVRHEGGYCLAILRPPAISIPEQLAYLRYIWNGKKITDVLDTKSILQFA